MCPIIQAQDFTSKFEIKIRAYEVKSCAYGVKIRAHEVNIRVYEVKIIAYEVKSCAQKSSHASLPRKVMSWAHWAERYDPKTLIMDVIVLFILDPNPGRHCSEITIFVVTILLKKLQENVSAYLFQGT